MIAPTTTPKTSPNATRVIAGINRSSWFGREGQTVGDTTGIKLFPRNIFQKASLPPIASALQINVD
jgi:hypothetical protein